jgi:hypothetical protein
LGVSGGEHLEAAAGVAGNSGAFDHHLDDEEVVLIAAGEAEEVARKQKIQDLSPTVGHQHTFSSGTGNNAVPVVVSAVDLSPPPEQRDDC